MGNRRKSVDTSPETLKEEKQKPANPVGETLHRIAHTGFETLLKTCSATLKPSIEHHRLPLLP